MWHYPGVTNQPKPDVPAVDDRSTQYLRVQGATGEIGIVIDEDARARWWVTVPQASAIMLVAAALAALWLFSALFMPLDTYTLMALCAAVVVSVGLPRSIGAPAPRYSSTVALIFSCASVIAVRLLSDLYISGIICALSVVAAFGAEMLRKDGRARLLDSISATVLTTAAATCSVAVVGLSPHASWRLAMFASAACVFVSMAAFEIMRHFWPSAAQALTQVRAMPKNSDVWRPGEWNAEDTSAYRGMQAINTYWSLTDTARTICVLIAGVVGAAIAQLLYMGGYVTGLNADALQLLGTLVGGGPLPVLVVGLAVGLLSGIIVIIGGRVLRPTTSRVSLWGALAWGILPTIVIAMPTYALVRLGS